MKKITLLLFISLLTCQSFTQPCPEAMIFQSQEEIDNFPINYPNCTEIEGIVWIAGEDITNVDGLSSLISIGDMLTINDTDSILNLEGFSNLVSVGSSLDFTEANILNLSGLDNLTSVGGHLTFYKCDSLTSFEGLGSLSFIGNDLYIEQNYNITNLSGFNNLTTVVNNVEIKRTSLVNLEGLNNLTTIGGNLKLISNYSLINFEGLNNLISIGEDLIFGKSIQYTGNLSLINLSGLNNLVRIGGDLKISNCDLLIDLSGLNNLKTIWGGLWLEENHSLSSLTGLNSLDTLRSGLFLIENENIESLSALSNLSILGSVWVQYTEKLKSLEGLENIDHEWIYNLLLDTNDSLSVCDVKSICDYLAEPDADYTISGNAEGCNSKDEVEITCETGGISDYSSVLKFKISPNPTSSELLILNNNSEIVENVCIYNQFGQKVLMAKPLNNTIDVSILKNGIYLLEISTKERKGRTLMIKQ